TPPPLRGNESRSAPSRPQGSLFHVCSRRSMPTRLLTAALTSILTTLAPAAPGSGRVVAFVDHDLVEPFGIDFDQAGRAYIVQMAGNRVSVLDEHGELSV